MKQAYVKVVEATRLYEEMLLAQGAHAEKVVGKRKLNILTLIFRRKLILNHLLNMVSLIQQFIGSERTEKAMRWLGFMQGALWVLGFYTLEELMDHNRPDDARGQV